MKPDTLLGIQDYIVNRFPQGSFLTAVFSNDLFGALGQADNDNRRDIFEIAGYIYNNAPPLCWGSPERVKRWLKRREHVKPEEEDPT